MALTAPATVAAPRTLSMLKMVVSVVVVVVTSKQPRRPDTKPAEVNEVVMVLIKQQVPAGWHAGKIDTVTPAWFHFQ